MSNDASKEDPPSLDDFSERLERLRGEDRPQKPAPAASGLGHAMRISSDLLAGLIVGGVLGYGLDVWLGTSPWFLLGGLGVGFAAGLRNMARTIKQGEKTSPKD